MADSPQDNLANRHAVGREAFARFLESLSPEPEEAARHYTRLHQKLAGLFSMKGLPDPLSAADETIDRAALKINAGTPVPDVGKYCLGIARNIVKERLRRTQRESPAFLNFVNDLSSATDEQLERIYNILKPCFEQLAGEEQQLLVSYCQVMRGQARAEHRRQLAETMKTTMLALRMRVTRLRTSLTNCVEKRTKEVYG
ncbi:MAG: hypothetical protein QOF02_2180 [Blastocatellia bacterium]|jgi:hypothetical protein|nr:hypothetical protein [Blastocatellia bacterium]